MSLTTEAFSRYFGKQASILLSDPPFKDWTFERFVDTDLEELRIDYIFAQHGMDFVCDEEDNVHTIFLYADESRSFQDGVEDLPFTLSLQEVIARLGFPSKSGDRRRHRILGDRGAWDRFDLPGHSIHVEYDLATDRIKMISLMRADVVP